MMLSGTSCSTEQGTFLGAVTCEGETADEGRPPEYSGDSSVYCRKDKRQACSEEDPRQHHWGNGRKCRKENSP